MDGSGFRRRPAVAWLCGPLMVALGVAAHLAVGAAVPALPIVVALAALLSMAASMTARVAMPGWAVLLLSGLVQQVLHLAFDVFSGSSGTVSAGHGHGILDWRPPQPSVPEGLTAHMVELMLYTHTAAALLTVFVITAWQSRTPRIASSHRPYGVDQNM
jgi:hypothetical protein